MATLAFSELQGAPVFDTAGRRCGRVRELALVPQEDRARIAAAIVRTSSGDRMLPLTSVASINGGFRAKTAPAVWALANSSEGMLLLARDLLDQQVIDVFGRKVVRVNDLELYLEGYTDPPTLKVGSVDVGIRGAVRCLLQAVAKIVPANTPGAVVTARDASGNPTQYGLIVLQNPQPGQRGELGAGGHRRRPAESDGPDCDRPRRARGRVLLCPARAGLPQPQWRTGVGKNGGTGRAVTQPAHLPPGLRVKPGATQRGRSRSGSCYAGCSSGRGGPSGEVF